MAEKRKYTKKVNSNMSTGNMSDREYVNVVWQAYGGMLDSVLTQVVNQWDLSVSNDFDTRIRECRKIIKNGEGKGIVPRTINAMIQSAVGKSTFENSVIFPNKMSVREKEIYTNFCQGINTELREATPGLNQFREWWFREYWTSSLSLSYWNYGYANKNIKLFIMNPLGINIQSSPVFGESAYYIKDDGNTTNISEKDTEFTEVTRTKNKITVDGTDYSLLPLSPDDDFQVTKRGSQIYDVFPVPYLIQMGVVSLHKYKEACRKSDTSIMKALVKMILQFRKGTDGLAIQNKLPSPADITEFSERIKTDLVKAGDKPAIIASRYDEDIRYITPDTSVLQSEKYKEVDKDIAEALGWIIVRREGSRDDSIVYDPKLLVLEIDSAVRKNNEVINLIFKRFQENYHLARRPIFLPPVMDIWLTDSAKLLLDKMYTQGVISREMTINALTPSEYNIERDRILKGRDKNDEEIFDPPVAMKQSVKEMPSSPSEPGRPQDDSPKEPKKKLASFMYDDEVDEVLLEEFYKVDLIAGALLMEKELGKHFTEYLVESLYEEAPYKDNSSLPPNIRKLSTSLQTAFRKAFNSAYKQYKDEEKAFRIAYSVINKMRTK